MYYNNTKYKITRKLFLVLIVFTFSVLIGYLSSKTDYYPILLGILILEILLIKSSLIISKPIYIIYGLAILVPFEHQLYILGLNLLEVYILFLLIVVLLNLFITKQNYHNFNLSKSHSKTSKGLLILIMIFGITSIMSYTLGSPGGYVERFIITGIKLGLPISLVFIGNRIIQNQNQMNRLIKIIIYVTTIIAIIGIIQTLSNGQYLSGLITNYRYLGLFNFMNSYINLADIQHIRAYVPGTDVFRAHGSFLSHNFYASYLGLFIPLTVIWCLWQKDIRVRLFYFCLLLIQILAVYLSYSRGGLYTLVLTVFLIFIFWNRNKRLGPIFVKVISSLLLILILISGILVTSDNSSVNESRYINFDFNNMTELTDRFILWEIALTSIKDNLILGTGQDYLDPRLTNFLVFDKVPAHNMFINIIYSNGYLGFIIFFLVLILVISKGIKTYFNKIPSENERLIILGLISGLICFIGNGMKESLLINNHLYISFWMVIMMIICQIKIICKGDINEKGECTSSHERT
ncbi:O-antigen ligase family protein [Ferdinandcohnia sp. Marseille-Q9671]